MTVSPHITVVILNYNGSEHTLECLESLRQTTYQPFSVLVVDNASTDDSVRIFRKILKPHELLELSINGGYSYGNNVGMKYAFHNGAQYCFVINNDTVVDPHCLEYLHQAISNDPGIGIIGPKVLYYSKPDMINFAGMSGSLAKARYRRIGFNEIDHGQYEGLVDTLYQDGCALLIARACYERVGGFDPLLWTYWEEFDLCMRAHLNGFRVCCCQKARILHKVSATLGGYYERKPHSVYYTIRNSFIFYRRYSKPRLNQVRAIITLLSRTPRQLASIAVKGKKSRLMNLWMVLAATLVGLTTNKKSPSDAFAPIKTANTAKF